MKGNLCIYNNISPNKHISTEPTRMHADVSVSSEENLCLRA